MNKLSNPNTTIRSYNNMNSKWLILILITNSMKSIVSIYSLKNMDYPEFLAYHCLESYGQLNTFIPNDAICFRTFIFQFGMKILMIFSDLSEKRY